MNHFNYQIIAQTLRLTPPGTLESSCGKLGILNDVKLGYYGYTRTSVHRYRRVCLTCTRILNVHNMIGVCCLMSDVCGGVL